MKRLAAIALLFTACVTQAAPVYRCGNVYSQTPCPGGKLIDAADPRTAAQRAEAKRIEAREKKLAAQMERDRRAQEAAQSASQASGFDSRAASQPAGAASAKAAKPKKKKAAKPKAASGADIVAVEPSKGKGTQK